MQAYALITKKKLGSRNETSGTASVILLHDYDGTEILLSSPSIYPNGAGA